MALRNHIFGIGGVGIIVCLLIFTIIVICIVIFECIKDGAIKLIPVVDLPYL
jgi:hypothetical protein